jgi:hypothetical protein
MFSQKNSKSNLDQDPDPDKNRPDQQHCYPQTVHGGGNKGRKFLH